MSEQIIDWDLALIQKYNYSGPRYTRIPPRWSFHRNLARRNSMPLWPVTHSVPCRCTCISRFAISCVISAAAIR